jgi:hypothetical protein
MSILGFRVPFEVASLSRETLSRDLFYQEDAWVSEGGAETFSEWRERLQGLAVLYVKPAPPPAPPPSRGIPTLNPGTR